MPDDELSEEEYEERIAARVERDIAAYVFEPDTAEAVLDAGQRYGLPVESFNLAVRRLIVTGAVLCPPSTALAPDAEARVRLGRFTDAMPTEVD